MDSSNSKESIADTSSETDKWYKIKAGMFLTSVTAFSVLSGFGMTLGMAKKQDPRHFAKGLVGSKEIPESGVALATRALGRASVYTITGYGLFCFGVWKLMGVHSFAEFREKVGNALPRLKRTESTGRNEFGSIRDLFQYLIDEDEKSKALKAEKIKEDLDGSSS